MFTLSPFQEKCGAYLRSMLRDLHHDPRTWEVVRGREETYVEADLGGVRIWIYEDGACWRGAGRGRVLEAVDYDSLEDLQRVFLTEIASVLTGRPPDAASSQLNRPPNSP
jgi:hypothetical protein